MFLQNYARFVVNTLPAEAVAHFFIYIHMDDKVQGLFNYT